MSVVGFLRPEYYTTKDDNSFYYKSGCAACPLKDTPGADMEPTGSKHPDVYILGEAPGSEEIADRRQFVGRAGQQLRKYIPNEWLSRIRWNNCVRSRPTVDNAGRKNRDPTSIELSSCRKSVEQDIQETKPRAIFGFGNVPLKWALGRESGITAWSGRFVPIRIGTHVCWFFPIMHPSYVMRTESKPQPHLKGFNSDIEFTFNRHLKQAFSLVDTLPPPVVHTVDDAFRGVDFDMRCNDNALDRIRTFVNSMYQEKTVGVDLETNALRPYNDSSKILTIALSGSSGTLAWPMYHKQARWSMKQQEELETILKGFLYESPCIKAVHNLQFEQEWFSVLYGADCLRAQPSSWGCSMGQALLLDSRMAKLTGGGPLSLAFLTLQHFGIDIKTLSNLDRTALNEADLDNVLRYNAVDARYHRLLHLRQARLLREQGLEEVYREHLRRTTTATLTQVKGIPVVPTVTDKLAIKYETTRQKVWVELSKLPIVKDFKTGNGRDLNPHAGADVKACLNELPKKLTQGLARDEKTNKIISVNEKALATVNHSFARLLLRYRKLAKVLSTYINPYKEHLFQDGLTHPQTKVASTRTWRTSAADFNYQNQPKRDEGRRDVRAQVAKAGHKVVSFDYAQIQARNIAMESLDEALVKSFRERYDIHSDWVERIARVHPKWIKEGVKALATDKKLFKKYRNQVKQEFVFSSFFGAKPKTVSFYLKCDEKIGTKLHEDLWQMFPDIPTWHKALERMYLRKGYVTGHSGFRRHGPLSHNELINAPIQADETIIVLDAMTRLSEKGWPFQANMEIHDDLTFIWPASKVDERIQEVLNIMLTVPYEWAQVVPIGVEVSIGDDWFKQEQVGEYFSDTWRKA